MHLGTLLTRHARYRPEHPAVVFEGRRLTYRELDARVNRLAHALLRAGLGKGDKIATVVPNCLELLETYWAAAKTGIVVVPASPLLQESGLLTLLESSDAVMVVSTGAFADTLARIRDKLPGIPDDRWVLVEDVRPAFRAFADLVAGVPADEPPDAGLTGRDPFNVIYSSGTTGEPKGIVHPHDVRAMYGLLFAAAFRITPESVAHLVDRKKDMIISGGVNVYPRDIEEVVVQHAAVREAAVFGVADPKWGETPVAAVVLREPGAATREALVEWINARVGAKFQRVSDVWIVADFPRNVAGKTLKRVLQDRYRRRD